MMNVETRAEQIKASFEATFGDSINEIKLDIYREGVKQRACPHLWVRMKRERFHDAVKHLATFGPIHNSVASGSDKGDELEVLYHLSLNWDETFGEVSVSIGLTVPKDDPHYPTITDIIPAALPTEREKQEFLGVIIDGIPDPRKLFLHECNIPDGIYPWRKDEHGPESLVRNVHEFDKPPARAGEEPVDEEAVEPTKEVN